MFLPNRYLDLRPSKSDFQRMARHLGARVDAWFFTALAVAILSGSVAVAAQKPDIPEATKAAATSQVVISARMASNDLQVLDIKYRVFYNKFENKFIPLTDFNFAANLTDELINALADDKRAAWRGSTPEEHQTLEACYTPKWWKSKTIPPPGIEGDRVLLINVAYSASIHFTGHRLDVSVAVQMSDRKSGRVLWKKLFVEKGEVPGTLEAIQADNQKLLKEALNKLMEQVVPKIKQHIAQSQI